jgi:excisionase family DNA binding protein
MMGSGAALASDGGTVDAGAPLHFDPDRLMDASEAAQLLQMSIRWILQAARDGVLPCIRCGRNVRFRRQSLLAWMEAKERR